MTGGARNPGVMDLDDEAMTKVILSELRPLLQLQGAPAMVNVIRHERAIAQYVPGHLALLREIERETACQPGLVLAGSSYRGISVNACVKEAEATARQVMAQLAEMQGLPVKNTEAAV